MYFIVLRCKTGAKADLNCVSDVRTDEKKVKDRLFWYFLASVCVTDRRLHSFTCSDYKKVINY